MATYIVDSKDNYSNYYGVGKMWSLNASADTFYKDEDAKKYGYMSNIITAKGDEQLEAVSFYTTDVNTQYEITIYTGTDKENPVSGSIASAVLRERRNIPVIIQWSLTRRSHLKAEKIFR